MYCPEAQAIGYSLLLFSISAKQFLFQIAKETSKDFYEKHVYIQWVHSTVALNGCTQRLHLTGALIGCTQCVHSTRALNSCTQYEYYG